MWAKLAVVPHLSLMWVPDVERKRKKQNAEEREKEERRRKQGKKGASRARPSIIHPHLPIARPSGNYVKSSSSSSSSVVTVTVVTVTVVVLAGGLKMLVALGLKAEAG